MNEIQEVFQQAVEKVDFISDRITINTFKYIGIGIGIFLFFLLLKKIFTKYILRFLSKITFKAKINLGEKLVEAFQEPMRSFFVVVGGYLAILFFAKAVQVNLYASQGLTQLFKSSIIVLSAWACYNLTTEHSVLYEELYDTFNIKLDKIVFPFLSKIIRTIIIALAICIVLDVWGFNINGFVAGLGIGGAALALSTKDALANIVGGFVIILDKPFSIGDYIKTPNVEGIVEDITFRSTKIRTLDKALVTEPNSTLSNSAIINWTKRNMRRINFTLGVTYGTSKEQLRCCVNKIREMLIEDEGINNETILVNFDSFGDSSLNIFIYCFTNTTEWAEYLKVKENMNYKIMDILESEGVSAAFPSTSIYFETPLLNKTNIEK
ncbi:mechanosensitive ion channel family protein [Clostridium sp. ZS2-4]|uniref:mechanosensitive ion channel family protein n=1 Tax=Clostridium sp. ZS2-4 TaxID=2987703 RepID=UPI00227A4204|nr:mechanosensitive ion channel family protein [Clostridium sp. ZS2-4]MCY6355978.1 mechanosensitive ion channel family protein [Clostridium sp. ZS2-4]